MGCGYFDRYSEFSNADFIPVHYIKSQKVSYCLRRNSRHWVEPLFKPTEGAIPVTLTFVDLPQTVSRRTTAVHMGVLAIQSQRGPAGLRVKLIQMTAFVTIHRGGRVWRAALGMMHLRHSAYQDRVLEFLDHDDQPQGGHRQNHSDNQPSAREFRAEKVAQHQHQSDHPRQNRYWENNPWTGSPGRRYHAALNISPRQSHQAVSTYAIA